MPYLLPLFEFSILIHKPGVKSSIVLKQTSLVSKGLMTRLAFMNFLMIIFDVISQGIIPIESLLTKIALKRLSILMDHSIMPEFMAFPCESHITFLT